MGQHKHNPNCQLAKEGKLPPKPKKMSKREAERRLADELLQAMWYRPIAKAQAEMVLQEIEGRKMRE